MFAKVSVKIVFAKVTVLLLIWTLFSGSACQSQVAFSPNGKNLLIADNKTVVRWNANSSRLDRIWRYSQEISQLAYSMNGKFWAMYNNTGCIKVYNAASSSLYCLLQQSKNRNGEYDDINAIAFSPDGKTIAAGSGGGSDTGLGTLCLWNIGSGCLIHKLAVQGWINSVAFSSNGTFCAVGTGEFETTVGRVYVWDSRMWRLRYTVETSYVTSLCFSPDSKIIAIACDADDYLHPSGQTTLLLSTSGKKVRTFRHNIGIKTLIYSPDGKYRVNCDDDNIINITDAETGKTKFKPLTKGKGSLSFPKLGSLLAIQREDNSVDLLDIHTRASTYIPKHF